MNRAQERLRFELVVHRRAGLRRVTRPTRSVAAPATVPAAATAAALATKPAAPPPALVAPAARVTPPLAPPLAAATAAATTSVPLPDRATRAAALARIAEEIAACTRCKLCEQRTKVVPGEGALDPPILFIGEGPGADEDRTGRPFVGKAGQLLDKMIGAITLPREAVYIANIVKCRPPGNRQPEPDEVAACAPFLERQIAALQPKLICTLGAPATKALVPEVRAISAARGKLHAWRGFAVIPTFHPAYLLREPAAKREAWADLQAIARRLGIELPAKPAPRGDEGVA